MVYLLCSSSDDEDERQSAPRSKVSENFLLLGLVLALVNVDGGPGRDLWLVADPGVLRSDWWSITSPHRPNQWGSAYNDSLHPNGGGSKWKKMI